MPVLKNKLFQKYIIITVRLNGSSFGYSPKQIAVANVVAKRPIYFSFNSYNSEAYFRKPNHGILLEDINAPENNSFFLIFQNSLKDFNSS